MITKCDPLRNLKFSKSLPHAFTERGPLMAADVLNGHPAVKMNVFVLRAFVKQRETLATNQAVLKFLAQPVPDVVNGLERACPFV